MSDSGGTFRDAAFYAACGAIIAGLFSIAASHILLALALAALLMSGERLRFPPIKLPLGLFMAGTVLSMMLSVDPASGKPQLRKFFVFLVLLVAYSTIRRVDQIRKLILVLAGAAALSGLRSFLQLYGKIAEAHAAGKTFYQYYVAERISGFMSHWMTFSGQQMIVLLLLLAVILFAFERKWVPYAAACGLVIGASLLAAFTRTMWGAALLGGAYLIWRWRPKLLWLAPVVLVVGFLFAPPSVKARITSIFRPHGTLDSNAHRYVTMRTGIEMIKAHPWVGLGPEQVNKQFLQYVPPDIRRPLPEGWYGHLHNIYLHYAAERGIPTMLMLMWLLGKVLWDFLRAVRRGGDPAILHGAIAVTVAMLAAGMFELNLGDSEVLGLFLAVVSFGYTAAIAPESSRS